MKAAPDGLTPQMTRHLLLEWKRDREMAFALLSASDYSFLRSRYIDKDWELTPEAWVVIGADQ